MLVVCALVAGTQMTWGLVVPVLPIYAGRFGAGPAALGIVVAVFGLGRLVINIPAGFLALRLDQRRLLLGAAGAVAALTLLTALVGSLEQLIAVRLLTGLTGGAVMTTGQALLHSSDLSRMGRTMATLQTYQTVGGALGPAVGGLVVGIDDRLPFVVGGAMLATVLAVSARRPLPQPGRVYAAPATEAASTRLLSRGLLGICVVGFAIFLVRFGGQQFLVPVLAYGPAGLTPAQLGVSLAAAMAVGLVLVRVAGGLADRWGRRPMVVVTMTSLGLACLGFLAAEHRALFLTTLVATALLLMFAGPPSGAYLAECAPPGRRALAVGINRAFGDAAMLVGPPVLGWLVAAGRPDAAVAVLGGMTVVAGLSFAALTRRRGGADPARRHRPELQPVNAS